MKNHTIDRIWLYASIICYLLMSLSFLAMPANILPNGWSEELCMRIAGISFWSFLLLGIVSQVVCSVRRRRWGGQKHRVGLICFFQNKWAAVADVAMFLSLIGLVVAMIATDSRGYLCYIFISLFVFSFCMHCICNGKNFNHILKSQ